MPWYVIQTYTGREEQLVEMIRRIVPQNHYGECFVVYFEQLRHRQQENQIHVLRLFPGYVFISSNNIEQLFRCLKTIPAMSKIMASEDFAFTPLYDGEAEFLLGIMDAAHVVRLSYVATDGRDHVTYLSGPLEQFQAEIRSYRFRKRYAVVRLMLGGHGKEVKLGIILNDDVRRELAYGKLETPAGKLGKYAIPARMKESEESSSKDVPGKTAGRAGKKENGSSNEDAEKEDGRKYRSQFTPGERVLVMEGAFEGSSATVSQVKKGTLKITVQMFGREILVEVSAGDVSKIKQQGKN